MIAAQCRPDGLRGVLEQKMPKVNMPAEAGELLEAADVSDSTGGRERRVSEQLIVDWEEERRRLGNALALVTLDGSAMTGPKWAHRFIIAVNPVVGDSSLLFYGASFAALLELPEIPDRSSRLTALLPTRYISVFTKGCIASTFSILPVRTYGAVEREDGRQELYRAAFIRVSLHAYRQQHFVLGAFNYRVAERQF
jgi:hypothetical protein